MAKDTLEFYDLRTKEKFSTNEYTIKKVGKRKAAVADSPSGIKSYRFLPKDY